MVLEEFFIQKKQHCHECGGTGKVYSDAWKEICELLRKGLSHIERQDPWPMQVDEAIGKAAKEIPLVVNAPVRIECERCEGKGFVFQPVELTQDLLFVLTAKLSKGTRAPAAKSK